MAQLNRTMMTHSYGIHRPSDLLEKLNVDAEKLTECPHPYDVFNFVVTAAVLAEWIQKFYRSDLAPDPFAKPSKRGEPWLIPVDSPRWMTDTSCFPNPHNGIPRHISNALLICHLTANASKHFYWMDSERVQAIGPTPPIKGWYDWFFTSRAPDLYLDFQGEHYGLQQIKGILLQFYPRLISYLEHVKPANK